MEYMNGFLLFFSCLLLYPLQFLLMKKTCKWQSVIDKNNSSAHDLHGNYQSCSAIFSHWRVLPFYIPFLPFPWRCVLVDYIPNFLILIVWKFWGHCTSGKTFLSYFSMYGVCFLLTVVEFHTVEKNHMICEPYQYHRDVECEYRRGRWGLIHWDGLPDTGQPAAMLCWWEVWDDCCHCLSWGLE